MNLLKKYKLWVGGALCLLVIGLMIGAMYPKRVSGAKPDGPVDVEVVQVEQKDVPIFGEWIGTLDGFTNADVRAQVTGYLLKQGYQEGAFVRKGQLLFEIDPRPFQAALDQAEGQLAQARAQLATDEAVQGRTQLDVEKYTPLAKEQAASQQDLDNAVQNNLAAKATVQTAQAMIKTAEAAVETARINLEFTRLVAPIDGIAGQAQLQVGALVNLGSGPVTSVSTVDPSRFTSRSANPSTLPGGNASQPTRRGIQDRRNYPTPSKAAGVSGVISSQISPSQISPVPNLSGVPLCVNFELDRATSALVNTSRLMKTNSDPQ
jgi:membrane fusion protein (multidrug efflux system)